MQHRLFHAKRNAGGGSSSVNLDIILNRPFKANKPTTILYSHNCSDNIMIQNCLSFFSPLQIKFLSMVSLEHGTSTCTEALYSTVILCLQLLHFTGDHKIQVSPLI